jgi:hypothetical protein
MLALQPFQKGSFEPLNEREEADDVLCIVGTLQFLET